MRNLKLPHKSFNILISITLLYLLLQIPLILRPSSSSSSWSSGWPTTASLRRPMLLETAEDLGAKQAPARPLAHTAHLSGLLFASQASSELEKAARDAWSAGIRTWDALNSAQLETDGNERNTTNNKGEGFSDMCPNSIELSGEEFGKRGRVMVIPCGMTLGSHLTVVGRPRKAREEYDPKISELKDGARSVLVSQFMMELQGLKTVEGEDPPRILHFNPRLRGDWSGKPVIEQNTCYRMQWGSALRCEGWKSRADEETGSSSSSSSSSLF